MAIKQKIIVCSLGFILISILGFWVLITPDNPFTRSFQAKISDTDASVIVGPYPGEEDFQILKSHNVTTIVSLLDPRLPHERVLLDRERLLGEKYGISVLNFPMVSIFGQPFGDDYETIAALAAEAIAREPGKVYLHCYLGVHRIKPVQELLHEMGKDTGTYLSRQAGPGGEEAGDETETGRDEAAPNETR